MKSMLMLCMSFTLLVNGVAYAESQEEPELNLAGNLQRIIDDGQGHELVLRLVKFGLAMKERKLDEERNARFGCSHSETVGSHVNHLSCRDNGIWQYLEEAGVLEDQVESGLGAKVFPFEADAGAYTSRYPIGPGELEEIMEALGPQQYNRLLISGVFQSKPLPDASPSIAELNNFAQALSAIQGVRQQYDARIQSASGDEREALLAESDSKMVAAIEGSGLSIERYNRISELVGQYPSLRRYISKQM